ncbi:MAG: 2-oxoacid:acceptor oxidoreductase [Acidimicrobiaceae bacterium]|nr:2-oxoacid:acceptor oxidoreductase [Acidimicrobiaceae bacterium]
MSDDVFERSSTRPTPLERGSNFQVRMHGRGGQGTVTGAELLSVAAFEDGLYAQAFPSFGSERMGAPVEAYCRIGRSVIRTREPVSQPDVVIIQDPTLLGQVNLFGGLRPDGYVLLNSVGSFDEQDLGDLVASLRKDRLLTVPATEIAREHLGRTTPNSALLGGFAAMTGIVSLEGVYQAIRNRFKGALGEANVAAARAAFNFVNDETREMVHATSD